MSHGEVPFAIHVDSNERAVRNLRIAAPLIALTIIAIPAARAATPTGFGPENWILALVAIVFAGATWRPVFSSYWRPASLIFYTLILGLIAIGGLGGDPDSAFVAAMLGLLAGALLLRWGLRWQAAISLVSVAGFMAAGFLTPVHDRAWGLQLLGLIAMIVLAGFAVSSLDRSDREADLRASTPVSHSVDDRRTGKLLHDIRNSLAAILGFVNLLENDDVAEADPKMAIARIGAAARAMELMISNAVDLESFERGRIKPNRRSVNPTLLAAEAAREIQSQAESGVIQLTTDLRETAPVDCDPLHLERILRNLLAAAVERTVRGVVSLAIALHGSHVRIKVTDHGPPIDSAALALLLHPDPADDDLLPSRLNLLVVRILTEANSGRFEAVPANSGLRVTVEFPIAPRPRVSA